MSYREIVKEALIEINPVYGFEDKNEIYGSGGLLDSLDLVRLVIILEEKLGTDLSSDKAMSYRNSPYRTIDTLVEFIEECLQS